MPDLLQRNFQADGPNQRRVADITEFATAWIPAVVAAVRDLHSPAGASTTSSPFRTRSTADPGRSSAGRPQPKPSTTSYGRSNKQVLQRLVEPGQYVSVAYTERLAEIGARPSIGSIGDSYDNSLAESVNGLYKTELIRRRSPWRNVEHVELETLAWVEWFNNRRLHSELGDIPPAEFEHNYYARTRTQHQVPTPTRT